MVADSGCPGCGGSDLADVYAERGVPVFVGHLYDDPAAARRAPVGDIALAWCRDCGFLHNRRADPALLDFGPGYEISRVHSPTYRAHLEATLDRLEARHGLRGRTVLEIGCGAGDFLRAARARGASGIGVDPTLPAAGEESDGRTTLSWLPGYWDPDRHGGLDFDLACLRTVLEEIPRPERFLRALRPAVAARDAAVYCEVYNARRPFESGEVWSVHYELVNWFFPETLVSLFRRCGFEPVDAGACFEGDQHLYVEARAGGAASPEPAAGGRPAPAEVTAFAARRRAAVERWDHRLRSFRAAGRRVVLWGSGGKGIGFLAAVPSADAVAAVVDVNPARQGKYVPVTGHRVVAPEDLSRIRPDVVVVTNPMYAREIGEAVAGLGLACEMEAA